MSAGPPVLLRKRLLTRQILAESLAVFIVGATLMHFFYGGKGGVLGDELGVPGHDSFYHLKMAAMIPEHGLADRFPWLRFCYFTDEGDTFVSHHYGFHLYLMPFVRLSQWLTGDLLAGGRWAITTSFALTLLLFNLLLVSENIRGRWLWLFFFLLLPFQFFTRQAYIRAINPSLVMMLLITLFMFRGRAVATGLAILAYTHLYLGGVIYAPVLVVLFVIANVAAPREDRNFPWKLVLFSLAGWIVGIAIHPYRAGMIDFLRLQVLGSGLSPDIPVGREWKPYEGVWWFAQMSGVLLILWSAAVAMRLRFGERINARTLMLTLAHFAFLVLTFKARRFIEYWPIFCLLSTAYLAKPILARAAGKPAPSTEDTPSRRPMHIGGLVAIWLAALALVGLAVWMGRWDSAERFLRAWPLWSVAVAGYVFAVVVYPRLRDARYNDAVAAYPKRLSIVIPTILAALAATAAFASHPLSQVQRDVRCGYDLPAIRKAMAFLKENSAPGDVVFTDDWDVFPVYFHYNDHNHYVVGLDPKFTHARRPDLWERYVKITRGQVPAEIFIDMPGEDGHRTREGIHVELADIRRYFGASFVVTDRDHKPLAAKLAKAHDLAELVYPSDDYAKSQSEPYLVFCIKPENVTIARDDAPPMVDASSVLYLSDLTPQSVEQGWGDLVADRAVGGGTIKLGSRIYAKGLGTHAPSRLVYDIPDGYAYFEATVGVDADADGNGSVLASVELDGENRFTSDVLTGVSDPVPIRIPLQGAKTITLRAEATKDGKQFDHIDWAEARLTP